MAGARVQRKPTFLRQVVLILLPVLVLAAVGLMSLRQDKILAEHDARERAGAIAGSLVPKILECIATNGPHPQSFSFQVNEAGQLIFPPPREPVPTPNPFDTSELNAEQARLWSNLQRANRNPQNAEALVRTAADFIDSNPPEKFAAAAYFDLGLLLARQNKFTDAAATFDLVAEKYPQAVSESGLPLRPMAQFQLFTVNPYPLATNSGMRISFQDRFVRVARVRNAMPDSSLPPQPLEHFVSMDMVCSNIVHQPTLLTPCLLERIQDRVSPRAVDFSITLSNQNQGLFEKATPEVQETVRKWRRTWDNHELSRQLYAAARTQVIAAARSPLLIEDREAGAMNRPLAEAKTNPAVARPSPFFWFETPEPWKHQVSSIGSGVEVDERIWLAVRAGGDATNQWFVCVPELEVDSKVSALVHADRIPDYFGVGIELAGKKIAASQLDLAVWKYRQLPGGKGPAGMAKDPTGQQASTILGTAVAPESGPAQLKVNVYLTSPTALYQRQRVRAGWFGLVILASIGAAVTGLLTGWRAFTRQQQLNEMKSNFVSSVSHELRAPIASVRLMAESLERGKIQEPPKQNEYFRFIVQECRRLSSLVENVLDFSRIEQGRKQYEFEPADLAALTRETVRLMEPYAGERGVQLKVELPEPSSNPPSTPHKGVFELDLDGRAMQQALVNLIDNAIKHSPRGETVTIGLEVSGARCQVSGNSVAETPAPDTSHLTPDTSHLTLFVEDCGPGIPPEEHEKIFERFYRRGSELRRETQGVGIGLSIVKHIVDAHGGRVVVRSAVGQGSRFTIELPVETNENRKPKPE